MKSNAKQQYLGFLNTPNLWLNYAVEDLHQFEFDTIVCEIANPEDFNEIRLGKRVEQFFNFHIKNNIEIQPIVSNIQIKNKKITVGELDVLLLKNDKPIHIEIVYKFYLFDPHIDTDTQLEKWIGPNRNDSLVYKLNKLKSKQLPLLYSEYCTSVLDNFKLKPSDITQSVCYKAQLFLPFESVTDNIKPLNNQSVYGFYISFTEFHKLKNHSFYLPRKLDWLVDAHLNVEWLNFNEVRLKIEQFIFEKRSPMVWLKDAQNKLQKCFITYW